MRARPDDAGPNDPDFPDECHVCGADNVSAAGELLDESHLTCGKAECIAAVTKLEAEDRAADEARAAEFLAEQKAFEAAENGATSMGIKSGTKLACRRCGDSAFVAGQIHNRLCSDCARYR